MNWGNAIVRKISHSISPLKFKTVTAVEVELRPQGDVKKPKKNITWLSTDQELVLVEPVNFDYSWTSRISL